MTGDRLKTAVTTVLAGFVIVGISGCGKDKVLGKCDEPRAYQSVVEVERIEVPEDLDPLDKLKEIPIPRATTPPRPEGSRCLESPPSVLTN